MTIEHDMAVRLIYLWTRDARLDVGERTKTYVRLHLAAKAQPITYSDEDRLRMAEALVEEAFD